VSTEGTGTIIGLVVFAALLGYLGFHFHNNVIIVLFYLNVILVGFSFYFFRDPKRTPPDDPNVIVSPADGKVIEIVEMDEPEFIEGKATRVAIFLSLFDVHINYVPYEGVVEYLRYNKGKFHPAYSDKASNENEHAIIGLETKYGKLLFKQMAGIAARRVVCRLKMGEHVTTGQKFGIIKFGSRMEVYIPDWAQVTVKKGDRLRAGESVIARVNEKNNK